MKFLIVGGILTIGIVVVGSLTFVMMRDNIDEPTELLQTPRDIDSQYDLTSQTSINANQSINDLEPRNTLVNTAVSNVEKQAIAKVSLYGNQNQSGTRVHQAINDLILKGNPVNKSILIVIEDAIANDGAKLLSEIALLSTRKNKPTALRFMANIVSTNDLYTATKSSIENKPEDVSNIVNVSVSYYPDFAQEVINAAVMTGEINSNDALLAAIAAGADPSTVSEATAAGAAIDRAGLPFNGLGGGGNGNEDFSASNN